MKKNTVPIICLLALAFLKCTQFEDPNPNYTYQIPIAGDELQTSSLAAEGVDQELIVKLANLIIQEKYKRIDGVLIVKNNKLVFEEYFHGYSEAIPHNIFSSTKSITSILAGIAIDKGFIDSINTPILNLLPEYTNLQNSDPRKSQITIKHLLNMNSGLNCEDWYAGTEATMRRSNDWVKFTLELPMVNDPGTHGSYCTGGVVTLGRIIENQSGTSLDQFASEYLFSPLGITDFKWNKTPDGRISGGGGELFLRPRDMAKIGLLMLNKGNWNGKQILSENWIKFSSENFVKLIGPYTGYGFLWWKQTFSKDNNPIDVYFASGNGGQEIFIIPSEEMVLVFTGANMNTNLGLQNKSMISDYILPSLK